MATDWIQEYEERAGILEFDAGFSRDEAENRAAIMTARRKGMHNANENTIGD